MATSGSPAPRPPEVVGGPAAWVGEQIAAEPAWIHRLDDVDRVIEHARGLAVSIRAGERGLAAIGRADVALDAVVELAAAIRTALVDGRGFALLRGLPVADLDDVEHQVLAWMIGVHVGAPLHQNAARDVLIHVRDQGKRFDDFGVRAYETTADLDYHTDSSDVVALYCLRPAMRGGTSTIVSSTAVHDEIVRRRPDLAALLHEPWPIINPVDGSVSHAPICARGASGSLFTRYGRKYTELAPLESPDVAPLTADQVAVLDLFDEVTRSPGMALDMNFQPGDIQFLDNTKIMHARTEYVDWPEPSRKRELLRMWLVYRDDIGLPDVFRDVGFVPRSIVV